MLWLDFSLGKGEVLTFFKESITSIFFSFLKRYYPDYYPKRGRNLLHLLKFINLFSPVVLLEFVVAWQFRKKYEGLFAFFESNSTWTRKEMKRSSFDSVGFIPWAWASYPYSTNKFKHFFLIGIVTIIDCVWLQPLIIG